MRFGEHTIGFVFILAVILVNCCVTCLWLILDVQLYDSGVAKGKSLAFDPKFLAKTAFKQIRSKYSLLFIKNCFQRRFNRLGLLA